MAMNTTTAKLTIKISSFVLKLLVNIFFYIIVVILTINVSKMAYDFTYQLFGPVTMENAPGTKILIEIQEGDKSLDVASKLENKAAIKNKYAFWLKAKLQKSVIMPGTYEISTAMTYNEILAIITDYSSSIVQDGEASDGANTGTDTDTSTGTITDTPSDTTTDTTDDTTADTTNDSNVD